MMVMTAKVDLKKTLLILAAAAAVIVALILIFGGSTGAAATSAPSLATNDGRVQFLESFGWDVATSPLESSQVKIPEQMSEVFRRYNALQLSQGYDLQEYAGKTVMRYVYRVDNYPDATEPVLATVLVHKGKVIGGDITDTAPGGKIQGFKAPTQPTTQPATQPTAGETDSGG